MKPSRFARLRNSLGLLSAVALTGAMAAACVVDSDEALDEHTSELRSRTDKGKSDFNSGLDRFIRNYGIDREACYREEGKIICLSYDKRSAVSYGENHEKTLADGFYLCAQDGSSLAGCEPATGDYSCGDTYCSCDNFDDCVLLGQEQDCDYNPFDDCHGSPPTCGCCVGCE